MGAMADNARVLMTHPDVDAPPVSVTAKAFDKAWSTLGWQKVTEDLTKLGKDDLVAAARQAGVDTSGTKAEIAARIENQET